ncbi:hypothetical protein JB92DRAFT_2863619 [Gautieria morchelliformis]|nr:hypothetical protein JB92DRAFT_2863619 [Gautieria morchelliformis]
MPSFAELYEHCRHLPALLDMDPDVMFTYIALIRHLKPQIIFTQKSAFIHTAQRRNEPLDMDEVTADMCWKGLRDLAWSPHNFAVSMDIALFVPKFLESGIPQNIGIYHFFPPTHKCLMQHCPNNSVNRGSSVGTAPDLREPETHQATLFSSSNGPLPVYTTSTYCRMRSRSTPICL